jgi:hypothetical protein
VCVYIHKRYILYISFIYIRIYIHTNRHTYLYTHI